MSNKLDRNYGRFSGLATDAMSQTVNRHIQLIHENSIADAKRKELSKVKQLTDDYNGLVDRYNLLVNKFNNLKKENKQLGGKIDELNTKAKDLDYEKRFAISEELNENIKKDEKIEEYHESLEHTLLNLEAYKIHLSEVNKAKFELTNEKFSIQRTLNNLYARNTSEISKQILFNQTHEMIIKILHVQNEFLTNIVKRFLNGEELDGEEIDKLFASKIKDVDELDASRKSVGYTEAVFNVLSYPTKLATKIKLRLTFK